METCEAFARRMELEFLLYLPRAYSGYGVSVRSGKNGYELILEDDREWLIPKPALYLDALYYQQSQPAFIKKAIKDYLAGFESALYRNEKEKALMQAVLNEFPENRIFYILAESTLYEKVKGNYPCRRFHEMVMLYSVLNGKQNEKQSLKFILIENRLLSRWGKKEEELYQEAKRNMPRLFPYKLEKRKLFPDQEFFLISSDQKLFGLSALFYEEGPLKEISKETNSDLMIVPVSVHEAAVFPCNGRIKAPELNAVLKEAHFFSNQIYLYRKELNRLAVNEREGMELEAVLRRGIVDAAEKIRADKNIS